MSQVARIRNDGGLDISKQPPRAIHDLFGIDPRWVEEALSIVKRQRLEWKQQKGLDLG